MTALVRAEDEAHSRQQQQRGRAGTAAVEHFGRSFALLDRDRRFVKVDHTIAAWLGRARQTSSASAATRCSAAAARRSPCPHALAITEGRRVVEEFVSSHGRPLRVEVWPAPPNDAGIATIHVAHDLSEERAVRSRLVGHRSPRAPGQSRRGRRARGEQPRRFRDRDAADGARSPRARRHERGDGPARRGRRRRWGRSTR